MANTLLLRRSSTASAIPTTGQLQLGELAANTKDGALYLKGNNGTSDFIAKIWSDKSHPTTLSGYGITDGQSLLVSGTNIKTVNGNSLLGSGDVTITASGGISYVKKTANYTAIDKDGIIADTSGGSFTITLPASPTTGTQVFIADAGSNWATNNLLVDPGLNSIGSLSAGVILALDTAGTEIQFIYNGIKWNYYINNYVTYVRSGWVYSTKTANYTALDKDAILADTTGGSFTITLPASPLTGMQILVVDSASYFDTNSVTINPNGGQINSLAVSENLLLDIRGVAATFIFNGSKWTISAQVGPWTGNSLVTLTDVQTLTNKTLTNPVINGFTGSAAAINIGSGQLIKDASGNIGIGKTPSAQLDYRRSIQVISTNTTAVASYTYVLTASLTLTLPASPTVGDWLEVQNSSGTTTATVARNGSNIMSTAADMTLDVAAKFGLVYADATRGWVII